MTDTQSNTLPLRSVSQANQYTRCPQAYKLARIDKVWARPAAWLPQGSAVHTVLEHVELAEAAGTPMSLEEAQEMFKEEYQKEIARYTEDTPNFDWWFWSGPYNGERDIARRWEIGLEQVEKFFSFKADKGQTIWTTPDGRPAIELDFKVELDGILVRGFIDAVVVVDGELRVRDYKTGNSPGDDFQLGMYALAISMIYDIEAPKTGDYYMAGKKGKPGKVTDPYCLTEWTRDAITERFHEVEAGIAAGKFDPLPEADKCTFCDVNRSCPAFNS